MKTIYKYPLTFNSPVTVPVGARILSAGEQRGEVMIWAEVDTEETRYESRVLDVIGTGHEMQPAIGFERRFINTVLMGPFVFHVFERV